MYWNVTLELAEPPSGDDRVDDLMEALADYHVAVGSGFNGRPSVTLTLMAENLRQTLNTAIVLVESLAGTGVTYAEAMPTEEFDARHGFLPIPELMSASDAGAYLGVSRVRVNQMIDEGRFPTAQKVGNGYVIPASDVWQNARLHTMIGWSGIEIKDQHVREIVDQLLDTLQTVGPVAAYNAAQSADPSETWSSTLAGAWQEAEKEALHELSSLGYDTRGAKFNAKRTGSPISAR